MKTRRIGYALWLLLAACLYFFENGTGTRIILLCSLLVPLVPPLRALFFSADGGREEKEPLTVRSFVRREAEEPGDVRAYRPGDPVRRIHWKLSAKKGELLVRETAMEPESFAGDSFEGGAEEGTGAVRANGRKPENRGLVLRGLAAVLLLSAALLLLIPEANRGARALCNRLFAASEAANAYAYDYFPVPENQSAALAVVLIALFLAALAALVVLLRSRALSLAVAAACTLFQVYFGLPLPIWANVPLYGLLGLSLFRRPFRRGWVRVVGLAVLGVSLAVALFVPGVDAATEAASEAARDRLSALAERIAGGGAEAPAGDTETRHTHTRALESGEREAKTGREFRLVTQEEERVSMPRWINWLKIALPLLMTVALLILPFAPFLLLNARGRRARMARAAFESDDAGVAVCAVFRQVAAWLEGMGMGAGNRPFREWADALPDGLPEGYAARFSVCAADFEEAAYSGHAMPEAARRRARDLLRETEAALWKRADVKQRLRLKVGMGL